ncbi:MAG: hypothetical protein ACPGWM_10260 [Flavobacteriales bacterium]
MTIIQQKQNARFTLILLTLGLVSLQSCGYLIRAVVAPNNCKKCEIYQGGSVVFTEDDCGGGVANMETRVKARAYDMGPDHTVECESYKQE